MNNLNTQSLNLILFIIFFISEVGLWSEFFNQFNKQSSLKSLTRSNDKTIKIRIINSPANVCRPFSQGLRSKHKHNVQGVPQLTIAFPLVVCLICKDYCLSLGTLVKVQISGLFLSSIAIIKIIFSFKPITVNDPVLLLVRLAIFWSSVLSEHLVEHKLLNLKVGIIYFFKMKDGSRILAKALRCTGKYCPCNLASKLIN
ncbi:unnamed protein product [Moneuplotes crassus]|uniref:Uncharacterized protein n=1 Tax=Euplotes crassus TaxID=5936 RepID=A0AAD2D3J9_EUPCR|nr:unnamed protein product [Moneuplotes crassus]